MLVCTFSSPKKVKKENHGMMQEGLDLIQMREESGGSKDKQESRRGVGFVGAPLAQQPAARPRVHSGVYLPRQLQEEVCGVRSLRHPRTTRGRAAHRAAAHYALPSTRSLPWICVKTTHCHSSSPLLGVGRSRVQEREGSAVCIREKGSPVFSYFSIFSEF
jgi:hypothetical protein